MRLHVVGNLCSCEACVQPLPCPPAAVADAQVLAYLDTLPRAQWAFADALAYAEFAIERERAVALAKRWLRGKLVA